LSAVKIDRDQQIEGGIYENLFSSLKSLLVDSFSKINNIRDKTTFSSTPT